MATFSTGNDTWDQGLNTLASGLFPDPSKVASAGYYGAKQRETQITADQILLERQNKARLGALLSQNAQGMGSAGLPQPGVPAQNQPAPVSPTAAPGGPTLSGLDLSHPGPLTQGQPPPMSSPNAVSPPSPNATGTNGSIPANDASAGTLHPATFAAPGGGTLQTGPAAANGSPADMTGVGQAVALAVQAGMPAEAASNVGAVLLYDQFRRGAINQKNLETGLAAIGRPAMLQDTGTTTRTGMTEAGATQRTGMEIAQRDRALGEQHWQFQNQPTTIGGGTSGTIVPRNQAMGKPAYETANYTHQNFTNNTTGETRTFTNNELATMPPAEKAQWHNATPDELSRVLVGNPQDPKALPTYTTQGRATAGGATAAPDQTRKTWLNTKTRDTINATDAEMAARSDREDYRTPQASDFQTTHVASQPGNTTSPPVIAEGAKSVGQTPTSDPERLLEMAAGDYVDQRTGAIATMRQADWASMSPDDKRYFRKAAPDDPHVIGVYDPATHRIVVSNNAQAVANRAAPAPTSTDQFNATSAGTAQRASDANLGVAPLSTITAPAPAYPGATPVQPPAPGRPVIQTTTPPLNPAVQTAPGEPAVPQTASGPPARLSDALTAGTQAAVSSPTIQPKPTPETPQEAAQAGQLHEGMVANFYRDEGGFTRGERASLAPEAEAAINQRAIEIQSASPYMRAHPAEAWQQAFGEKVANGNLPRKINRDRRSFSNENIVYDKEGKPVYQVPYSAEGGFKAANQAGTLVDKSTLAAPPPAQAQAPYSNLPPDAGPPRPGPAAAPAAPAPAPTAATASPAARSIQAKPQGAAFAAPQGLPEGGTGTSNGMRYMNRGGWMFPVEAVPVGR